MNLPAGWQELVYPPLSKALIAFVGATLLVFFTALVFSIVTKKAKLPGALGFIQRHPKSFLALVIMVMFAIFGAYVYYYFNQPVRIVSAAQFKLEKGKAVNKLQQERPPYWKEAGVYLLDTRNRSEYAAEHLKASDSKPAEIAAKESSPMGKVDLVVYSTNSRFDEARRTAYAIEKNGELVKTRQENKIGKIYLIRDGFEGLKKAGLVTETGGWD